MPEILLKDFPFSNLSSIEKLKSPLFILHGDHDEICPHAMAIQLFEKAPGPKGFFTVLHGTHNDLPMAAGEDYWERPYQFLREHAAGLKK